MPINAWVWGSSSSRCMELSVRPKSCLSLSLLQCTFFQCQYYRKYMCAGQQASFLPSLWSSCCWAKTTFFYSSLLGDNKVTNPLSLHVLQHYWSITKWIPIPPCKRSKEILALACVKLKEVQPNCRQSKTLLPLIAIALIFVKVNVCRHCILVFIEDQTPTLENHRC